LIVDDSLSPIAIAWSAAAEFSEDHIHARRGKAPQRRVIISSDGEEDTDPQGIHARTVAEKAPIMASSDDEDFQGSGTSHVAENQNEHKQSTAKPRIPRGRDRLILANPSTLP